ncbi:multicopper oxidase domain-containing protein [Aetokthonos hydrillicola]|nr:multicopper oxidase domain-containing protein [Aetokthonos hydrillicola CCALA 1050]MBW4589664.1 multicopper oxidase domain-containing protein [Aetokthonos hydrillicola CCALA 1050]
MKPGRSATPCALTIYHCHILDHEDQGMMRAVNLTTKIENP